MDYWIYYVGHLDWPNLRLYFLLWGLVIIGGIVVDIMIDTALNWIRRGFNA